MLGLQVLRRWAVLASVLVLLFAYLVFLGATGSGATSVSANTSYYVDNAASCPGLETQASPWCDFSVVNTTTFQPGDQLLLKRGETYSTSGMILFGSGTSSNNLTVSAYGSGALPIIDGSENPSFIGINIYDSSYVTVSNVAIENAGLGILINDVTNETGFTFLGLDLSGNSEGIQSQARKRRGYRQQCARPGRGWIGQHPELQR